MQIGINSLYIKWGVNAGTETYFSNIAKPWYESQVEGLFFTLYCNQLPPWWNGDKSFFKAKLLPMATTLPGRILLEQIILPFGSYRNLDVLFCPGYVGCILLGKPQVITIHDGFAWRYPKEIGWMRGLYWRSAIPLSARRAVRLIAVSQNTAEDIIKFCHIPSSKITVVREAGGHLKGIVPDKTITKTLGLSSKSYFHCVGVFKEIKNPWRILEAYKRYLNRCDPDECKQLVLVGREDGEIGKKISRMARKIPNVVIAGRVGDQQLAALYQESSGLVFPSLYEGFGIPILEAQSFGCPVITSNVSSMPEVAGDGAIFVDPLSVDSICDALNMLSNDDDHKLVERGTINLKRFSWKTASDKTLESIKEVALGARKHDS